MRHLSSHPIRNLRFLMYAYGIMGNCLRTLCDRVDMCCCPCKKGGEFDASKYDALIENANVFDVVAFSDIGCMSITSTAVQSIGNRRLAKWSHIGVLVNSKVLDIENGVEGEWYVWESTCLMDVKDVESNSIRTGTQLRSLRDLYKAYGTTRPCSTIQLFKVRNNPFAVGVPDHAKQLFTDLHRRVRRRPFDFSGMAPAACSCLRSCRDKHPLVNAWHDYALFDAELVAVIYVAAGMLPPNMRIDNVISDDFFGSDRDNDIPNNFLIV